MTHDRWTPMEIVTLRQMWNDNKTTKAIATKLGRSIASVTHQVKRCRSKGIDMREKEYTLTKRNVKPPDETSRTTTNRWLAKLYKHHRNLPEAAAAVARIEKRLMKGLAIRSVRA